MLCLPQLSLSSPTMCWMIPCYRDKRHYYSNCVVDSGRAVLESIRGELCDPPFLPVLGLTMKPYLLGIAPTFGADFEKIDWIDHTLKTLHDGASARYLRGEGRREPYIPHLQCLHGPSKIEHDHYILHHESHDPIPGKQRSSKSSAALPFLLALSIIIFRIALPVPQNILTHPLPNNQPQRPRNTPHKPIRPPRKRQTDFGRMQKQKQLRRTRLHTLIPTILEIRIQVAEEPLADTVVFWARGWAVG